MKPINIEAAKELIVKYRSITLKEIKEVWNENNDCIVANTLTGFSKLETCTLCIEAKHDCCACIYGSKYNCLYNIHAKTYNAISYAKTPIGLLRAFRRRANHIEEYLKTL